MQPADRGRRNVRQAFPYGRKCRYRLDASPVAGASCRGSRSTSPPPASSTNRPAGSTNRPADSSVTNGRRADARRSASPAARRSLPGRRSRTASAFDPVSDPPDEHDEDTDPPYHLDDPEHRLALALREARRTWPAWYKYLYAPFDDLESGQYDVLWCLAVQLPAGCRMGELAVELRIDSSTATRAVDRLVRRGLAKRVQSRDDKRVLVAQATSEGRRLVNEMSRQATGRWRPVLRGTLSPAEMTLLSEWLERLVGTFDAAVAAADHDGQRLRNDAADA